MIYHPIDPIYNTDSKVLILGSFPSVKSREEMFYYAHPQNRFWKILSLVLNNDIPVSIVEKRKLLLDNNIALWDVIYSCEIIGSSDSSIKNVIPNDINEIINKSKITHVILNGKTSEKYYTRFIKDKVNIPSICLPSTSPANARCSLEKLYQSWSVLADLI